MRYMLCDKLILSPCCIVGHCFEDPANSLLIVFGDASVLMDQVFFGGGKHLSERRRAPARQHVRCIDITHLERRHVSKVEGVCAQFIIFLGAPTDAQELSKLCLI